MTSIHYSEQSNYEIAVDFFKESDAEEIAKNFNIEYPIINFNQDPRLEMQCDGILKEVNYLKFISNLSPYSVILRKLPENDIIGFSICIRVPDCITKVYSEIKWNLSNDELLIKVYAVKAFLMFAKNQENFKKFNLQIGNIVEYLAIKHSKITKGFSPANLDKDIDFGRNIVFTFCEF